MISPTNGPKHSGLLTMISLRVERNMYFCYGWDWEIIFSTFSKKKPVFPIVIPPREIAATYLIWSFSCWKSPEILSRIPWIDWKSTKDPISPKTRTKETIYCSYAWSILFSWERYWGKNCWFEEITIAQIWAATLELRFTCCYNSLEKFWSMILF